MNWSKLPVFKNEGLFESYPGDVKGMKTASFALKSKFSRKLLQNRGQWERGANRKDAIDHLMQTWVTPTLHLLSPLKNLETNCHV